MARVVAAIGVGSNLGERASHLTFARDALGGVLSALRFSSIVETDPVGVLEPQGRFLNAAAVGETRLDARELLSALLALEGKRGRQRPAANAPRTLDLDLLLFGDLVLNEPGLQIPHPRFRARRFVLEPLAEIAPGLVDPVTRKTIVELLSDLTAVPPAG